MLLAFIYCWLLYCLFDSNNHFMVRIQHLCCIFLKCDWLNLFHMRQPFKLHQLTHKKKTHHAV